MIPGYGMDALWRRVHGIAVRVITSSPEARACAQHLFHHFATIEPGSSDISLALHVVADPLPPFRVCTQATLLHVQGELTYLVNGEGLYISVGHRGVFHTDCAARRVVGHITPELVADLALLRNLVLNALAPLLRRHGIFPLHGFAAARGDRAAVLVGRSGSGKTTAGLALVRSGWEFLSNDHPLLQQSSSSINVLCYCEPINISPTTATFFPELRHVFN